MLKQRILTAIVLVALLLAFLFAPYPASLGFFALVIAIAAWEWGGLAALSSGGRLVYALVIVGLMGLCAWQLMAGPTIDARLVRDVLGAACAAWAILLLWVLSYPGSASIWGSRPALLVLGAIITVPAWVGLAYLRVQ
jgi:phosphatidate cytidylyltransferase